MRCSNQLSYEATDVGSRSFPGSYVPLMFSFKGAYEPRNGFIVQLVRAGANPVEVLNVFHAPLTQFKFAYATV